MTDPLRHLAERNYRTGPARRRDPQGLGLGLHIAKDVATRHGLTLEFRAREAGGLEVVLAGPRAE